MKRHYGGPVSGDMFWPRPTIVEPVVATLKRGESCALFGLKRIGKSSILLEVEARLKAETDFIVVRVDAQRFAGLDELFAALMNALPDTALKDRILSGLIQKPIVAKILRNLLERIKSGGSSNASAQEGRAVIDYWSLIADDIETAIKNSDRRLILMVDELPFMLENMLLRGAEKSQIDSLLAALRGWRHRAGVVNVFAGSIGMQWLLREHGIQSAHLNDFISIRIPPLSKIDARLMLEALVAGEAITWWRAEQTDAVLAKLTAYYPSFLQYAFGRVCDHRAISEGQINSVFEDQIRPGIDASFFRQFRDRFARYGTIERQAAGAVISTIAKSYPASVNLDIVWSILAKYLDRDLQDQLVEALRDDGFLDVIGDQVSVTSPLIVGWSRSLARQEAA